MELPSVAALEFDQLRASIKNYIKTKSDFTDYDFEGSNLSMLVDILAYNTLYTSYNINMAANELNLDTAVLRDNIVSHAKKLGYIPNSYTSAVAQVDIQVTDLSVLGVDRIGLSSGPVLSTRYNGKNYTFVSRDPINLTVPPNTDTVTFRDVELIEGSIFTISYTVDSSNENQRFIIPNNYVDSDTVSVTVRQDATATASTAYERRKTIVGVSQSDPVFFVEEIQDQKYEVVFGDDVIGRKLQNGEIVTITYVVTSGSEMNNIKESSLIFVGGVEYVTTGGTIGKLPLSKISFTLNTSKTEGGADFESIASIKYRAPRYYAAQERAVTISDYESLIMQLYANADLVKVVGGETLSPPQYGKVFITIKPKVGQVVSESQKDKIVKDLKSYIVGSITPVIRDSRRYIVKLKPVLVYDKNKTRKSEATIKKLTRDIFINYENSDAFKNFGGVFSQSSLISSVQNIDNSIKYANVQTISCVVINLSANNQNETKYDGSFFTRLKSKVNSDCAVSSEFFCTPGQKNPVQLCVKSFSSSGCVLDPNIYLIDSEGAVLGVVGQIDFETGEFSFSVATCSDDQINICAIPESPNFVVDEETYPEIEIDDVILIQDGDETPDDLSDPDEIPVQSPVGVSGDPEAGAGDGALTPITDDQNNIITIDNFTPETDPNKCS